MHGIAKLLIVEDDIASLELMAEVFTSLKAEVFQSVIVGKLPTWSIHGKV